MSPGSGLNLKQVARADCCTVRGWRLNVVSGSVELVPTDGCGNLEATSTKASSLEALIGFY